MITAWIRHRLHALPGGHPTVERISKVCSVQERIVWTELVAPVELTPGPGFLGTDRRTRRLAHACRVTVSSGTAVELAFQSIIPPEAV